MKPDKGFTLIELLVVIAIIAVLAVVVILTINPAELLRQARDSTRISDMGTLKSALSLYLTDVSSPQLVVGGLQYGWCYSSLPITPPTTTNCAYNANSGFLGASISTSSGAANYRKVDSTGWIPVNLSSISFGSPLSNLPVDPVNASPYFYAYAATSTGLTFEITAKMESIRYSNGGSADVESKDGGRMSNAYEVGTAPGLSL